MHVYRMHDQPHLVMEMDQRSLEGGLYVDDPRLNGNLAAIKKRQRMERAVCVAIVVVFCVVLAAVLASLLS